MSKSNTRRDPSFADVAGFLLAALIVLGLFCGGCEMIVGVKHLLTAPKNEQVQP